MNEPYPPLAETLARVEELCRVLRKSREDVLDVMRLSPCNRTDRNRSLSSCSSTGSRSRPVKPEAMVRERVRFLFEQYSRGDLNQVPILAAAIQQTPTWTRSWFSGKPSRTSS